MIWAVIFTSLFVAAVIGFIYLISRVYKFDFIKKFSYDNKKIRIILSIIFTILIFVVICFFMGYINAVICMLHLVLFWLLCDLLFWIIKKKRNQNFKRYYAGILAFMITTIYMAAGFFQAYHVWETNYTIKTDKKSGNLHIIHFADSHIGTTFDGKGFSEYVKQMQELNPDIVLITGDFIDDDTSKDDMILSCKALGTLQTSYGVYFSFGNHDKGYYGPEYRGYNESELITELEKNNVKVLQDESILIDNRFYIIGRQDLSEKERGNPRAEINDLVNNIDKSKFIIVMDHQPNDYDKEAESEVDLVLSGHTHGGQFFPINNAGVWLKQNDKTYGYEKRNKTDFIVTSGISDWALKFKTGCKSEYVVIDVIGS